MGVTITSPAAAGVVAPIGSVFAWLKEFTNTPALPSGWVECNGQVLDDGESVYDGETIPDLNEGKFLRGNATSGGTGGESTHTLTTAELAWHLHSVTPDPLIYLTGSGSAGHGSGSYQSRSTTARATGRTGSNAAHENKPPYYNVVWIMRVK